MLSADKPIASAPELCRLDSTELVQLYASRELSPVDVVKATLERAEQVQERFNAFSFIDSEGALNAARASEARWRACSPISPIDGVPTTIKDIVWVRDWVVRFGSRTTATEKLTADAPSVALLRKAGAIFIGQTASPEFAWKPVTDSPLRGVTRNPWDPSKTPGGSSGGAAVAAATGAGVFHLGTDGGGSIRIPASFSGVVGLKPTYGRVPNFPPSGFFSVSHTGPMTRSTADASRMLAAMSGRDLRDWTQGPVPLPGAQIDEISARTLRIGFWIEPLVGKLDPQVEQLISAVSAKLQQHGATVVPFQLPLDGVHELFDLHWLSGAALRYSTMNERDREAMDPGLRAAAEQGLRFSAVDLLGAQVKRVHFGAAMDAAFADLDVVISPATSHLPFDVGLDAPPSTGARSWTEWASFSYPFNLTGQPASVLPCGFSDSGLPIGLQVVGARGADGQVLSITQAFESIFSV